MSSEKPVKFIFVRGIVPVIPVTPFKIEFQFALTQLVYVVDREELVLTIMPLTTVRFVQCGNKLLFTLRAHFSGKWRVIGIWFWYSRRAVLYKKLVACQPGHLFGC
jgi:hypothetical protein